MTIVRFPRTVVFIFQRVFQADIVLEKVNKVFVQPKIIFSEIIINILIIN